MGTRSHLIRTAFAAALLAVLVVVPETPALAIHRGEDADIAAYPFMVSLRLAGTPDSPRCGGTLIEPDIVLTAGHCVAGVPLGCTNAPPVCRVMATSLQSSDQSVLDEEAECGVDVFWTRPRYHAPTTICTKGVEDRSTINRGDSGGPLLVRDPCSDRLRQVGVTSLGADSTTKLYAGFTSIPVEAGWIAEAVAALRAG